MRANILQAPFTEPFTIQSESIEPYCLPLYTTVVGDHTEYSAKYALEGLALKTYQSDLFNNWVSTEWIDGDNGVSKVTAIDTTEGSFTIDELMLSRKSMIC